MSNKKIFCIGFSKTGTSSLHEAFKMLGIRSCHHISRGRLGRNLIDKAEMEGKRLMYYMDEYDAYSDMALINYYQALDQQYPNSKYILTDRDPSHWVNSKIAHDQRWNEKNPGRPLRSIDSERRQNLLDMRVKRYEEVFEYFRKNDRLLVIDVTAGDGWSQLCEFLGVGVPSEPFPFINKSKERPREKLVRQLKAGIYKLVYPRGSRDY